MQKTIAPEGHHAAQCPFTECPAYIAKRLQLPSITDENSLKKLFDHAPFNLMIVSIVPQQPVGLEESKKCLKQASRAAAARKIRLGEGRFCELSPYGEIPAYPACRFCRSIAVLLTKKSGEIWIGQANLQPIPFKPDRLLEPGHFAVKFAPWTVQ